MKMSSISSASHLAGTPRLGLFDGAARRLVLRKLNRLQCGRLTLIEDHWRNSFGEPAKTAKVDIEIRVNDGSFFGDLAFAGSIGAAEAYIRGAWSCDDLVGLVRLLIRNRHVLDSMEEGTARLSRPLRKLFHWLNRNTRRGARRNISAHYDLGNDFFALWLDESMMYSSAVFENAGESLADAQLNRLNMICGKLELGPGDHLIEIGTGWGSLAIHAAKQYGCRVTTTTISKAQYDLAHQRITDAGLHDRIELLMEDYRDLKGRYDKLVSVEMIEAIGSDQYDAYFRQCDRLLKPGGRMLIQAITIADRQYGYAQNNVDFIQRYIFPGGCLPCLSVMIGTIARVSRMLVTDVEDIGRSYALTLNHWRRNFLTNVDAVRDMGYSEEFVRMWEFYLCYCEGGFLERVISDVHLMAEKPSS